MLDGFAVELSFPFRFRLKHYPITLSNMRFHCLRLSLTIALGTLCNTVLGGFPAVPTVLGGFAAEATTPMPIPTDKDQTQQPLTLSGSIQSDNIVAQDDDLDDLMTNTFAELHLQSKYIDAGLRFEYLEHPLPGFESDYKGWGVPHLYVKGRLKSAELTLGDFYEQFGSGFILRTYEERALGIDNALRGARLQWKPFQGVTVKALTGRQRRYWNHNKAWISGADVSWDLVFPRPSSTSQATPLYITLGASFVNKHEGDEEILVDATRRLNLPTNVNAFDVRLSVQRGGLSLLAEYAHKSQDPNYDNGYIYRKGYVAMLSASYSRKGASLLVQAKRSDNMSFRSRRTMSGLSSMINHLPAFTQDHTYALAALYPYATHPDGEWAYQAEGAYTFKKGTFLGGRYGTGVKLNFSHIHSLNTSPRLLNGQLKGSNGYASSFWKWGADTYYQDLNIQVDKKISKNLKLNLMYMNQRYNKTIVEGEGGMIRSNIIVGEGKYRFSPKVTLRGEAQYLFTADDEGDWAFGLLELSVLPHWMFTVSDQYNVGQTHRHYYQLGLTFNVGAHRLQAAYGRTRSGFNCSGGVCRYVPGYKGLSISYNYNF